MKSCIVESLTAQLQNEMYARLKACAETDATCARLWCLPVALADSLIQVLKYPFVIIENLAFAAINLYGMAVSDRRCSGRDFIWNIDETISTVGLAVGCLITLPFKLFYQIFIILDDPVTARTINPLAPVALPEYPVILATPTDVNGVKHILTNRELNAYLGLTSGEPVPKPQQSAATREEA